MSTSDPNDKRSANRAPTGEQLLIQPDEGRPHPGRLLLYLVVAVVSMLVALLPGLDVRDDSHAPPIEPPPAAPRSYPSNPAAASNELAVGALTPAPAPVAAPVSAPTSTPAEAETELAALDVPPSGAFSWQAVPQSVPRPVVAPDTGVLLGAYHDPLGQNAQASLFQIVTSLPEFNAQIGRTLAIVSAYQPWAEGWARNESLAQIADTQGAIPMISWRCGEANELVAAGQEDALIFQLAQQLRAYGRPVLLRWFWEMNLANSACLGEGTVEQQAANYRAAFQRIAMIFDAAGATNVALVWAPSTATVAEPMDLFYPGDEYVDWIGADGYSRRHLGAAAFATQFGSWYAQYAGKGKPMIVAETGATDDQVEFLRGIAEVVPRDFPQIKAIVYFDATGQVDWRLTSYGGAGVAAFAELGRDPYFSVMPAEP